VYLTNADGLLSSLAGQLLIFAGVLVGGVVVPVLGLVVLVRFLTAASRVA
jgi:hypothetical protein